jgi:hypothetical protein
MLKRALTARKISFSERNGVITTSIKGTQISIGKDTIESRGSRYNRADATAMLTTLGNELLVMAAEQSVDESAEENGFTVEWSYNDAGEHEFVLERPVY